MKKIYLLLLFLLLAPSTFALECYDLGCNVDSFVSCNSIWTTACVFGNFCMATMTNVPSQYAIKCVWNGARCAGTGSICHIPEFPNTVFAIIGVIAALSIGTLIIRRKKQ